MDREKVTPISSARLIRTEDMFSFAIQVTNLGCSASITLFPLFQNFPVLHQVCFCFNESGVLNNHLSQAVLFCLDQVLRKKTTGIIRENHNNIIEGILDAILVVTISTPIKTFRGIRFLNLV